MSTDPTAGIVYPGQDFRPVLTRLPEAFLEEEWAVAAIELNRIARGFTVCDAMMKVAAVTLLEAAPLCPGKYLIIVGGEVASVESAYETGLAVGETAVIDRLLLAKADWQIFPALVGEARRWVTFGPGDSLGVIETCSATSAILAADAACKAAEVRLYDCHIAQGLGGKGYLYFFGELNAVEASVEAGGGVIAPQGLLVG
ncbi:MAG: BMC domain-containing protein, partial [Nitrospinota bacterium]